MDAKKLMSEALDAHNKYRAMHGVPSLSLNLEMCVIAQRWATTLAQKGIMEHSSSKDRMFRGVELGENIAMKFDSRIDEFSGEAATTQWYDEIERYNFDTHTGPRTGHFTQLVWKDSQQLGIGRARTRDGKWLVVANYFPAGNFVGEYEENVFPLQRSSPPGRPDFSQQNGAPFYSRKSFEPEPSQTFKMASQEVKGTSVSRSTRTETTRDATGKILVKTIVTETTIDAEGNKSTTTTENVETKYEEDDASESGSEKSGWRPGKFLGKIGDKDKDKKKSQSAKEFAEEVVKTHNKHRKTHGKAGDLKHSKELDVLAQSWADHLATIGCLSHSTNTFQGDRLGENVASRWSSGGADYTGSEVVEQWYSEVGKYDYDTDHQSNAGHFSQVVWKGSKSIGVGKAFAKDGRVFVVCNYHPAGNVLGQFKDNVFAAKK